MANVIQLHSASSIARIDEVIARHKRELYDLYFQRNSMIPIFRLPTETLQAIFTCLARDSYARSTGSRSTVPRWVNVTYVCRQWRDTALNCSTLWSYLFNLSPRWTEELLERSKQASLHVHVDISRDGRSRLALLFLEQVTEHTERIQELRLRVASYNYFVIQSSLSSRAPRLTNLLISVADDLPESNFPSVLFDGDTPLLRTLNVTGCPTSWYSFKVAGLTTFRLRNVPAQFQQNTADLLTTLGRMCNLTYLELYNTLSSATAFLSSAEFTTFPKFDLPRLSHLRIKAPTSTVIALLYCLCVPLETLIRLKCASELGLSLDDYALLSSLLAQRFGTSNIQAPSSPIVRSLGIGFEQKIVTLTFNVLEDGCRVSASKTDKMWDRSVPLKIAIQFHSSMTDHDEASITSDICCSIPPTDVQDLCVLRPPSSSAFWRKTLGHFQGIRYLTFNHGRMPDLASLLSVGRAEDQDGYTGGGPEVCTPALEKLELCNLSFTGGSHNIEHVQSLCDALSRRKESEGLLVMDYCSVTNGRAVKLDMVGRWEDGRFRVVEGRITGPCGHSQSGSQDSEELEELEESPWIWEQLARHTDPE